MLFRSKFRPLLPVMVAWGGVLLATCSASTWFGLLPSLAGRGGEGRRCDQGVQVAATPACCGCSRCRAGWKKGGCGEEVPWPCAFSVLQFRRLRRTALAVFYMSGVLPFPGLAAAWCLLLRRCSAVEFFRRCGGSAASFGAAVALGSDGAFFCVFLFVLCCFLC